MSTQFCTDCGHSVAIDAKFCENCGAVFGNTTLTDLGKRLDDSPARPLPDGIKHVRVAISAWVVPFNATLVFGSTLIAVFDFLSPRVALLPIAATVAVVGLLAAIALRKFVAPSLPPDSTFRRALAPESRVHKSPVLIATGLLSALMVSGAAWSSAESTRGGVIASKFDAARVAQLHLGILQGMQKEQRLQTAVMEDIREGRAVDPRRELNNIGGGFNGYELDAALDRADSRTVQLLLAGGLKWRVENAYAPFANSNPKMSNLLLENMLSFEARVGDCERLIEEKFGLNKPFVMIGGVMQPPVNLPQTSTVGLKPFQIDFLKKFCSDAQVKAFVKGKLLSEQSNSAAENASAGKKQFDSDRSRETCEKNKNAKRLNDLDTERRNSKYRKGPYTCISSDCSWGQDRLTMVLNDEKKYAQVVKEVFSEEFPKVANNASGIRPNLTVIYQQILDAIS